MRHLNSQPVRFILAGGTAAAINWLARIALSSVMPLAASVLVAYGIGMLAGFMLYRAFVFEAAREPLGKQIAKFLIVNAFGAGIVLATTIACDLLLRAMLPSLILQVQEAVAHAIAIAIGAFANYAGHKQITFAPLSDAHSR